MEDIEHEFHVKKHKINLEEKNDEITNQKDESLEESIKQMELGLISGPMFSLQKIDSLYLEIKENSPIYSDLEKKINKIMEDVLNNDHPNILSEIFLISSALMGVDNYKKRFEFCCKYAWAIPTREAIEKIVLKYPYKTILEVASGAGLWGFLLKAYSYHHEHKVHVILTDDYSSEFDHYYYIPEKLSHKKAIATYNADVLMISWPPDDVDIVYESLREFNGNYFIYIGEPKKLMLNNDGFVGELEKYWKEEDTYYIPQWAGFYDRITFYQRRTLLELLDLGHLGSNIGDRKSESD